MSRVWIFIIACVGGIALVAAGPVVLPGDLDFLFPVLVMLAYIVAAWRQPSLMSADNVYFVGFALTGSALLFAFLRAGGLDNVQNLSGLTHGVGIAILTTVMGVIGRAIVLMRIEQKAPSDPLEALLESARRAGEALEESAARFGSSLDEAGESTASAVRTMGTDLQNVLGGIRENVTQIGAGTQSVAAGGAALHAALRDMVTALAEAGQRLEQMRAPGGVSADELNRTLRELAALANTLAQMIEAGRFRPGARPQPPRGPAEPKADGPTIEPEPLRRRSFWGFVRRTLGFGE